MYKHSTVLGMWWSIACLNALLQGSCPNCGSSNSTYFGDILTVKGNREKNEVQCGECKAKLQFDSGKRQVSIAVLLAAQYARHLDPAAAVCVHPVLQYVRLSASVTPLLIVLTIGSVASRMTVYAVLGM